MPLLILNETPWFISFCHDDLHVSTRHGGSLQSVIARLARLDDFFFHGSQTCKASSLLLSWLPDAGYSTMSRRRSFGEACRHN